LVNVNYKLIYVLSGQSFAYGVALKPWQAYPLLQSYAKALSGFFFRSMPKSQALTGFSSHRFF